MTTHQSDMLDTGTMLDGGKYRIVRQIASGGFGNTYEAVNVKLNARCAIKELFVKGDTQRDNDSLTVCVSNAEKSKQFESLKRKFRDEAHRLSELKCEYIVQVYDLFDDNGTVYYVMELIDGQTLTEIMEHNKSPFSQEEVRKVLSQMLDALEVVHAARILHMDIKPSNIMMNHEGNCKLIDFGTSKQQSKENQSDGYTTTIIAYSPGYAPAEQISGNKSRWGVWTDYYELGATIYHLLTGKRPPLSEDIMVDGEEAFAFPEETSSTMKSLVMWMMKPKYTDRPQSIREIRNFLEKIDSPHYEAADEPIVVQEDPWIVVDEEDTPMVDINKPAGDVKKKRLIRWLLFFILLPAVTVLAVKIYDFLRNTDTSAMQMDYLQIPVGDLTIDMRRVEGSDTEYGDVSPFYIAQSEVTQKLWKKVMGNNPSKTKDDQKPVESVSWNDCLVFIHKLDSITGMSFRLPTETEWELVASQDENGILFKAIADNVAEWCFDIYSAKRLNEEVDPLGNEDGPFRVYRGLPFQNDTNRSVSERHKALKEFRSSTLGLRLAMNTESTNLDLSPKSASMKNKLGIRYFYGMGIRQDYKKAVSLFQQADSMGDMMAAKNLASCCYWGIGTEKNLELAALLFKKAAQNNVVSAQQSLAVCYYKGQGLPCSYKQAFSWFQKAATSGNPYAQCFLAEYYYKGIVVDTDKEKALDWYAKSAEQGYAPAQHMLSLFYKNGIAVTKNEAIAEKWSNKALEQRGS